MLLPSVNFSDPNVVCDTLHAGAKAMLAYYGLKGCTHHLPGTGNILISGDLHDNPLHLLKIIKLASLDIPTNHVILQELIHSGRSQNGIDLSYRMLVRVAALTIAYPSQVHPILANHELAQATGRPITKGGGELVEMFNLGVHHVFCTKAEAVLEAIRTFIMAMPIAAQSASGLMCCHSLPSREHMGTFDRTLLARAIQPSDLNGNNGSAYTMVWGRDYSEEQINALASHWGVKLFCLGHALVSDGIEVAMDNMIRINSDHAKGAALPLALESILEADVAIESAVRLATVIIKPSEI